MARRAAGSSGAPHAPRRPLPVARSRRGNCRRKRDRRLSRKSRPARVLRQDAPAFAAHRGAFLRSGASLGCVLDWRGGATQAGSITAIYTFLLDGEFAGDPIAEEAKSLPDGHIALSPAVGAHRDWLRLRGVPGRHANPGHHAAASAEDGRHRPADADVLRRLGVPTAQLHRSPAPDGPVNAMHGHFVWLKGKASRRTGP